MIVVASALTLIPREIWTIRADDVVGNGSVPAGSGLDVSGLDDAGIDDPEIDQPGSAIRTRRASRTRFANTDLTNGLRI